MQDKKTMSMLAALHANERLQTIRALGNGAISDEERGHWGALEAHTRRRLDDAIEAAGGRAVFAGPEGHVLNTLAAVERNLTHACTVCGAPAGFPCSFDAGNARVCSGRLAP